MSAAEERPGAEEPSHDADEERPVAEEPSHDADEERPVAEEPSHDADEERPVVEEPPSNAGEEPVARSVEERPHARERPLPAVHQRPWAVGVYLAFASLVGLAWAAPLAAVVTSVTGAYPRGDAEIFDAGGVMLLEAARRALPAIPAVRAAWLVTAVVAAPLGLVALAFAIAQLGTPGRSRPAWALARAVRSVPTLLLVALVALLADVVVVVLILFAGGPILRSLWPSPPARDMARLAQQGLVVLALLAVGALHDLARVAAVAGPARTYMSMRASLLALWRAPGRVSWAYAWRAIVSLAAMGGALYAGTLIGQKTAAAVVASAFVHQLGLASAGWLRLSWLSAAARVMRPIVKEREDAAERESAPERSEAVIEKTSDAVAPEAVASRGIVSDATPGDVAPNDAAPREPSASEAAAVEAVAAESTASASTQEPSASESAAVEGVAAQPAASASPASVSGAAESPTREAGQGDAASPHEDVAPGSPKRDEPLA